MKNIKKDSRLAKRNDDFREVGLSNKKNEINSAQMVITLISDISCGINSFLEVQKEREKTLQIQSEANARIVESNNKLKAVLVQEKVKMDQIKADFILKMKEIENDTEKNRRVFNAINVVVSQINILENALKKYDIQELQHNEFATKLLDMLHTQVLSLTQLIPSIKA